MTDIFKKRDSILPYEYPELLGYSYAIQDSFWTPRHFTYDKDVKDFQLKLSDNEKKVVERCMLLISIVENKVKSFWCRLDQRMPKVEVTDVAFTFGGNEVIHRQSYQELLNRLGLIDRFNNIENESPCIEGRMTYLSKYLDGVNSRSNKEFTKSLILFTLLVENVSLMSQFFIVSSFYKYKNLMRNFSEIINASAIEENLHGTFGANLIQIIKKENPEWFDQEMEDKTRRAARKAIKAETEILDWIFEDGELDFLKKEDVSAFAKHRLNDSLVKMGYKEEYDVKEDDLEKSDYFNVMITATGDFDFFAGKSPDYNEKEAFDEEGLW